MKSIWIFCISYILDLSYSLTVSGFFVSSQGHLNAEFMKKLFSLSISPGNSDAIIATAIYILPQKFCAQFRNLNRWPSLWVRGNFSFSDHLPKSIIWDGARFVCAEHHNVLPSHHVKSILQTASTAISASIDTWFPAFCCCECAKTFN